MQRFFCFVFSICLLLQRAEALCCFAEASTFSSCLKPIEPRGCLPSAAWKYGLASHSTFFDIYPCAQTCTTRHTLQLPGCSSSFWGEKKCTNLATTTHARTQTCIPTAATVISIKWALCLSGMMDCLAPTPPPLLIHMLTNEVSEMRKKVSGGWESPKPQRSSGDILNLYPAKNGAELFHISTPVYL